MYSVVVTTFNAPIWLMIMSQMRRPKLNFSFSEISFAGFLQITLRPGMVQTSSILQFILLTLFYYFSLFFFKKINLQRCLYIHIVPRDWPYFSSLFVRYFTIIFSYCTEYMVMFLYIFARQKAKTWQWWEKNGKKRTKMDEEGERQLGIRLKTGDHLGEEGGTLGFMCGQELTCTEERQVNMKER